MSCSLNCESQPLKLRRRQSPGHDDIHRRIEGSIECSDSNGNEIEIGGAEQMDHPTHSEAVLEEQHGDGSIVDLDESPMELGNPLNDRIDLGPDVVIACDKSTQNAEIVVGVELSCC